MASIFPGNRELGLPAVHGAYILLDGLSGIPLLSIDGNAPTHLKTAADSALGSSMLAREDCQTLLMVGAGAMAPHLIEAHLTTSWPITTSCARVLRVEPMTARLRYSKTVVVATWT
jgi:ornithine cyclodeaminase/alanine dehydrogenase-like protein (mu-crystallin family)